MNSTNASTLSKVPSSFARGPPSSRWRMRFRLTTKIPRPRYNTAMEALDLARRERERIESELERAKSQPADLQKELKEIKEHKGRLQKEFEAAQKRIKDLSAESVVLKQHRMHLEAELESAKQRASAMESVFDACRSGFNRFDEHMTALVSSSKVSSSKDQSNPTRPSSAPAQPNNQQRSAKEGDDGLRISSDQINSQALVSPPNNGNNEAESTKSFCEKIPQVISDQKHWKYNNFFFGFRFFKSMNLTIMGRKLQNGAFLSADPFQTDFDLMINECKSNKRLGSIIGAAGEKLKDMFDEAWSAVRASDPAYQQIASQVRTAGGQNNRGHKRKASTELSVTSENNVAPRRPPGPPLLGGSNAQPASLANGEDTNSASPQPEQQTHPASDWLPETGLDAWRGTITTGFCVDIIRRTAKFDVAAKAASFIKSPNTFQAPWTELLPTQLHVQLRRAPREVEDQLWDLECDPSNDMFILRLVPSSEAERVDFDHLHSDLISKARCGKIRFVDDGHGRIFHLIAASTRASYPKFLSRLDPKLFPPFASQSALFLVVVFRVGLPEQRLVRKAWDHLINAVHTAETVEAVVRARDRILNHSLPLHRESWRRISLAKDYMHLVYGLPFAQPDSMLASGSEHMLNLSYSNYDPNLPARIGDIELPSRVLILGGVVHRVKCGKIVRSDGLIYYKGMVSLAVVDLQHKDRPVWEICKKPGRYHIIGDDMRLLRRKFPHSWDEWERTAAEEYDYGANSPMHLGDLGLKVERCGISN
ncbi:Transcription factor bye1 [Diaporthe australafricana]|uniref:Transcription factor bye1 n=1 Tax=Diaporthe australafricana TaxID=127596 RepID=A0ABR3XQZ7_9PEZI